MANQNYTPAYRQYTQQSAGYTLPSSVRTYSVFDPASNSWRRMTNDGMSPMPQGNQADIQAALAQARQTRGTVYPAEGMGQGQPVEMHPGYLNPPVQTPAQMPSGGSVRPSPASGGGGASVSLSPAPEASQRASQRGFKASGQPEEYLSAGMPLASRPTAYPEGYRAVVSPDNQVPAYTIDRNGIAVPNVSGIPAPEQVVQRDVIKATPAAINVVDVAQRGLPENFIRQPQKENGPSFYWDPSERGEMNYNEEMKNLGRAISDDPETASRVGEVWGSAALAAAPVGAMVGALGKGAMWGTRALAGTKLGKNLANSYKIVRNNAIERGRQVANYLGDRFYNPQNIGQKGFEKFNFNNFVDSRVPPSVQAQRLANYQQYLQNTARVETPLPPNAIRPLKGFENFRTVGF